MTLMSKMSFWQDEQSLLMGNFSLLEIIISRLDDEDRYALAGYLSQVFAHHLSTFNIDWCMEMLMSQSTEIDRHSFILGQSNTGFCEIMIRNLISEEQTQKYMRRLLAPVIEHIQNIDTEMKVITTRSSFKWSNEMMTHDRKTTSTKLCLYCQIHFETLSMTAPRE